METMTPSTELVTHCCTAGYFDQVGVPRRYLDKTWLQCDHEDGVQRMVPKKDSGEHPIGYFAIQSS